MSRSAYDILATRSGDWWAIEVTSGLPANVLGVSQARRLTEVETVARSLIVDLLEVSIDDVEIDLLIELPAELRHMIDLYRDADVVENAARSEAALARSRAAAAFLDAHLTMREAGELLGVSHQRIKQLVDRAPDSDPVDLLERIEAAVTAARRERDASTMTG